VRGTDYGGYNVLKHIQARTEWEDKSALEQGFTLIELLVVIAILGILAVVGVLAFGGLTDSAKNSTARTEKTQIQTAVDGWRAKDAPVAKYVGPYNWAAGATPGELVTETVVKPGITLQCAYTADTSGNVTFQATQTDPNCK